MKHQRKGFLQCFLRPKREEARRSNRGQLIIDNGQLIMEKVGANRSGDRG